MIYLQHIDRMRRANSCRGSHSQGNLYLVYTYFFLILGCMFRASGAHAVFAYRQGLMKFVMKC